MTEFILHQYELLFENYLADRSLVPQGNLLELSFRELDADPLKEIEKIYDHFGWAGKEAMGERVLAYTQSLADFKKNDHRHLPEEWKRIIYAKWKRSFDEFGYQNE